MLLTDTHTHDVMFETRLLELQTIYRLGAKVIMFFYRLWIASTPAPKSLPIPQNESINNFLLLNTSSARTFSVWFDVLYVPGVYSNE